MTVKRGRRTEAVRLMRQGTRITDRIRVLEGLVRGPDRGAAVLDAMLEADDNYNNITAAIYARMAATCSAIYIAEWVRIVAQASNFR